MTVLDANTSSKKYKIIIGKKIIGSFGKLFNVSGSVLVLTDTGVPKEYALTVANSLEKAEILTIPMGEEAKSFSTLQLILKKLTDMNMGRDGSVVCVGGGVVGDIGGFAASIYMRGIKFYNVPTTVLSQVDSSVGGKCAINFEGIKNSIGSFYQASGVLIDTETLKTLDDRLFSEGLAEAIKMSLTSDRLLFERFEAMSYSEIKDSITDIVTESIKIKLSVVEKDERESGLRRILNFGHTIGHAIEESNLGKLFHGECVALGMLPVCSGDIRKRLIEVLKKTKLPYEYNGNMSMLEELISHDKKRVGDNVKAVFVEEAGTYKISDVSPALLSEIAVCCFSK